MNKLMALTLTLVLCLPLSMRAQVKANPAVQIALPAPPKTISPAPGESRSIEEPLTFRWDPVFLATGNQARYRLVITPVFAEQTAAEALEQNQPLLSRILSDPSFEYEPGAPAFRLYPMAVGFAWQVQAVDTGGHPVAANLGKSEISSFTIVNKIPPPIVKKLIPETLVAGTFRIEVEEYDQPSKSVNPKLPSGTGRVKFTCPPYVHPFPWKNIRPALKTFSVVQNVTDSLTQIHINDALAVNPAVRSGDKIQLSLPERSEASQLLVDRNLVIGLLKGLKAPGGLRVRFRDVEWTGPLSPVVVLSEGIAWYPAAPVSPPVPAQIAIEPGFSLAIDSLVITPSKATVRGSILLPPCIISNTACTRSSLSLPWTAITGQCELYREVPDSSFGPFYVGQTGVQVAGKGYTIDFSSVHSDPSVIPSLGNAWKGIVLKSGSTPDPPSETVLSNRGYVKAKYTFTNGLIISSGLEARLNLDAPFAFRTVEPMGYLVAIHPPEGYLKLSACAVQGGQFLSGEIHLPIVALRSETGGLVRAWYDTLHVQNDMDLFGAVKVPGGFTWGEFSKTSGAPRFYQLGIDIGGMSAGGYFYLAARQLPPYYPVAGGIFVQPSVYPPETELEAQGIQGVTLTSLGHRQFTIWTQDVPGPGTIFNPRRLVFAAESVFPAWMNVIGTGVHTEVRVARYIDQNAPVLLGPTWSTNPRYLGETPFKVSFKSTSDEKQRQMRMQFVESATWYSDFDGTMALGGPINANAAFTHLTFTSTANAGGAELDLSHPLTMDYWGVTAVPKDSTKSAGVVCVKLGVIYLTAAGIAEPRHFSAPFWLTWGEIKASGNMGRLFFDYNAKGQRFDRFPYTPSFVKLSDYNSAAPGDSGFVITYGTLAFNFFGAKPLWVYDWKSVNRTMDPFGGRTVRIPASTPYGTGGTDLHLQRNWGDGVADLNFTVVYDSLVQEGFVGPGSASINKFVVFSAPLPGAINVKADRSCFSLNHETDVTMALAPLMTTSALAKVWGCGCIVGESLERVAVGGELSANNGAGFSILARSAGVVSVVMGFSPSRTDFLLAGDAFVVLLTANAEVVGYMTLTIDRDVGYAEGYAKGIVTMDAIVAGLSGQGEFQWHIGTDNETMQGRVAVSMYGMGWPAVGAGLEAGLWFGINSNKDNVWVMDGISGRFGLNKAALPQYITGLYAYMSFSASVSYYVVSGGFQAYAGVGAFAGYGQNTGAGFGVIGNVGLYVWGKILGGLVSADAWGDLQIIVGVPPAFQGTLGLDACVLWVFCGSVTVNAGFNANQGFYLY
jgi:hypothetical protein